MRSQFTFYESFFKAVGRIKKKADRADAYDMICAYALYRIEPDLDSASDAVAIAFELLRPVLDKAQERSESGKKGRSKPETNREQTGSKPEANQKLTGNKPEANREQTGNKKEKEKEKEKEIEIKKEKERNDALAAFGFGEQLSRRILEWLRYKAERHEGYKPQGLHSLLRQIDSCRKTYGEDALCELIQQSMANGWKGIIFDRLKQGPPGKVEKPGTRQLDEAERAAIERVMGGCGRDETDGSF